MNKAILNMTILSMLFLLLFAVAQVLYYKFKVNVDITRKIVHIGTGVLTLLFPLLLGNHWQVLILCATFAIILTVSKKFNLLKSIHSIDRFSYGSILYPVAVYCCYVVYYYFNKELIFFYLPVLILAICDPVAAIIGSRFSYGIFYIGKGKKSLSGSISFFISSVIVSFVLFNFFSSRNLIIILPLVFLIALISTVVEALSTKGTDNITIPASVILVLTLCR